MCHLVVLSRSLELRPATCELQACASCSVVPLDMLDQISNFLHIPCFFYIALLYVSDLRSQRGRLPGHPSEGNTNEEKDLCCAYHEQPVGRL